MSLEQPFDPSEELRQDEPKTRIGKNEAHDEANMMNVRLEVSPETGKIDRPMTYKEMWFASPSTDRQPTKEEYKKAFQDVEEIIKTAQEDPEKGALISKVANVGILYPLIGGRLVLLSALYAGKVIPSEISKESRQSLIDREINGIKEMYYEAIERSTSAQKKLDDLKESGKEFGDMESKRDISEK